MIEVRDGNAKEMWVVYCCPECERKFQGRVEMRVDYSDRTEASRIQRQKRIGNFDRLHEYCGVSELNKRLKSYVPDWEERTYFSQMYYAENPGCNFEDANQAWKKWKEGLKMNAKEGNS